MTAPLTGRQGTPARYVSQGAANTVLAYTHQGVAYQAALRCVKLGINYGLNAEESHSRQTKAFYPHRRHQGSFTLTFAHMHWSEYNAAMSWFAQFAVNALAMAANDPAIYIDVSMPSRDFVRSGIPTTGMTFGDHTASMVFNPAITFISARDSSDPQAGIVSSNQVSRWSGSSDPFPTAYFYPGSVINQPGQLNESLYNSAGDLTSVIRAAGAAAIIAQGYKNKVDAMNYIRGD
jgi:hypothetical protein